LNTAFYLFLLMSLIDVSHQQFIPLFIQKLKFEGLFLEVPTSLLFETAHISKLRIIKPAKNGWSRTGSAP